MSAELDIRSPFNACMYRDGCRHTQACYKAAEAELQEWRKLRDPVALHANLLSGKPAALTRETFLHLAGAEQLMAAREAAARQGEREHIVEIMRHVDRLQRHVEDWQRWLGQIDVLLRHQLPSPPSRTQEIMADLDAVIRAGLTPPTAPL